jgi:cyclic-di-AMP phosphodiesterase PgpH
MNKIFISKALHNYYGIFKILSFVTAAVLVMWFMPRIGKFRFEFQQGKPWQHASLYAPFDFSILKSSAQIKDEKEKISKQIYPYFVYNLDETKKNRDNLELIIETEFSQSNRKKLQYLKTGLLLFDKVHARGIVQHHKILDNLGPENLISTVKDRVVTVYPLNDLFTITSAYEYCRRAIDTAKLENPNELLSVLSDVFVQNLVYDERITKQELEQAMQRISTTFGLVQKGELIIAEGEPVEDDKFLILNSLRLETENRTGSANRIKALMTGQLILVLSIFTILFLFIRFLRNDVFQELKKINMILFLMLFTIIPSYLILHQSPTFVYLLPFGILPILLITFFDSRTTVLVHLLTIFLVSIVVPNAFQFVFLQLVVGYVVVFGLEKHNKRLYFFRVSILIFLTYVIIYAGFSLMQVSSLTLIDASMIWMFGVSALLTLLALPLIFLLERIFGQITDLTLLELSNTNSPLLREMASRAPGTFQHSIQVANLSEEALYEIGGDVLLARTGALYHDIGKMNNAYYYIENQLGGYNPHDDITPGESATIIIDHVLNGIEMARKANLPEQIIDFIRTHHGTSLVNYFYIMEQRQNPGLTIDERDFRYKGPIPFSKETAVVMMADSVEAASRSLKNPSEQKINDLIENIIGKQIESNQFLNANITFKEIHQVKKILKKKLLNIYHVRIAYPE